MQMRHDARPPAGHRVLRKLAGDANGPDPAGILRRHRTTGSFQQEAQRLFRVGDRIVGQLIPKGMSDVAVAMGRGHVVFSFAMRSLRYLQQMPDPSYSSSPSASLAA